MRPLLIAIIAFLSSKGLLAETYDVIHQPHRSFTTHDGLTLSASLFKPIPKNDLPQRGRRYPAVIYVHSWGLNKYQYIFQAKKLAAQGFYVMSYSTRGFGSSEGVADISGPLDMKDVSSAIDFLYQQPEVAQVGVGMIGMSYGGGISLLASAYEPRIGAVAVTSTFVDLTAAIYDNATPRLAWGSLLILMGKLTGRFDQSLVTLFGDLLQHRRQRDFYEWAKPRSALFAIDRINKRQVPIYISASFDDNLFQVDSMMNFYNKLTGPKQLDLNQGGHGTAELGGLAGLKSYPWDQTRAWMARWLQGNVKDRSAGTAKQLTMSVKNAPGREVYGVAKSPARQTLTWHLQPRGYLGHGKLAVQPAQQSTHNNIFTGLDSAATTGIPLVSNFLDNHLRTPVILDMADLDRSKAMMFQTGYLAESVQIRGGIDVKLNLYADSDRAHVVAYLYDVDRRGRGRLISHGVLTTFAEDVLLEKDVKFQLVAHAYNVPAKHKLALVLDSFDILYSPPTLIPQVLRVNFGPEHTNSIRVTTRAP